MLNFSSSYLSVSSIGGKKLEGKDHVLFMTWSCGRCHWIKSWPYSNSYEIVRSDIIIPIVKMKKKILNGGAARHPESKSREVSGTTHTPELEPWLCYFLGDFRHIRKTSVPQCLQLKTEGNNVLPLTTEVHFPKEPFFLWPISTWGNIQHQQSLGQCKSKLQWGAISHPQGRLK